MSNSTQIQEDLRYVREVVTRRERTADRPVLIYYVWAVYVLVGYSLIDFAPAYSGWFFLVGGIVGGVLSAVIGRNMARRRGEVDGDGRRAALHWMAGILLAIAAVFALAAVSPELRAAGGGQLIGQIVVLMIGLVYFLGGVHFDRNFLWLGPLLIAGGVVVGRIPHYGWTALGIVISLGLVVPTLFAAPRGSSSPPEAPLAGARAAEEGAAS